jgi:predicted DNA-binding WGR domain protein
VNGTLFEDSCQGRNRETTKLTKATKLGRLTWSSPSAGAAQRRRAGGRMGRRTASFVLTAPASDPRIGPEGRPRVTKEGAVNPSSSPWVDPPGDERELTMMTRCVERTPENAPNFRSLFLHEKDARIQWLKRGQFGQAKTNVFARSNGAHVPAFAVLSLTVSLEARAYRATRLRHPGFPPMRSLRPRIPLRECNESTTLAACWDRNGREDRFFPRKSRRDCLLADRMKVHCYQAGAVRPEARR